MARNGKATEEFPRNPWAVLAHVERVLSGLRTTFGDPQDWSAASGRRGMLERLYELRRRVARTVYRHEVEYAQAFDGCCWNDPLAALKAIAFSPGAASGLAMQQIAYRAFLAATAPCPLCGGMERAVDACGNCDETGRVARVDTVKTGELHAASAN